MVFGGWLDGWMCRIRGYQLEVVGKKGEGGFVSGIGGGGGVVRVGGSWEGMWDWDVGVGVEVVLDGVGRHVMNDSDNLFAQSVQSQA